MSILWGLNGNLTTWQECNYCSVLSLFLLTRPVWDGKVTPKPLLFPLCHMTSKQEESQFFHLFTCHLGDGSDGPCTLAFPYIPSLTYFLISRTLSPPPWDLKKEGKKNMGQASCACYSLVIRYSFLQIFRKSWLFSSALPGLQHDKAPIIVRMVL